MAKTIPFPQYAPDADQIGMPVSRLASGCIPRVDGYAPMPAPDAFATALPAPCRGKIYARLTDGSIAVFAATEDRIYRLDNTTLTWVDVSKGGVAYSALLSNDNWEFKQFNNQVIAVQIGTPPQYYDLSSSTEFDDLAGSPPTAKHVAIINRFLVLTGLASNPRRAQWCDLDDITQWTAGVGLADYQDFADGGLTLGIVGGDSFGIVFQQTTARSFIYAPGSPYTFQISQIGEGEVLLGQYTPIAVNNRVFYVSTSGFKMIVGAGGTPLPIGKDRVDQTFTDDLDADSLRLLQTAIDPIGTRVYFTYKSRSGQAGLFDKILCFDWAISDAGKWSLLPVSGQFIGSLAKPGITLESLDALAPTPLNVLGAADNGAGLVRLTLDATSNPDFDIAGQNFIVVQGVTGTVEANGTWVPVIVDATHIDLLGTAFVNAYTGGGQIGGSLDALPFSLDDVSTSAQVALSVVNPANQISFFDGPNMEAIVESQEQDGEGTMAFISGFLPLTDCEAVALSLGWRNKAQGNPVYTDEVVLNEIGQFNIMLEARYISARCRFPAGSVWKYVRGLQPLAAPAGER